MSYKNLDIYQLARENSIAIHKMSLTLDHIQTLFETGSLIDELTYQELVERTNRLGKMLNNFIAAVSKTRNKKPATR